MGTKINYIHKFADKHLSDFQQLSKNTQQFEIYMQGPFSEEGARHEVIMYGFEDNISAALESIGHSMNWHDDYNDEECL